MGTLLGEGFVGTSRLEKQVPGKDLDDGESTARASSLYGSGSAEKCKFGFAWFSTRPFI